MQVCLSGIGRNVYMEPHAPQISLPLDQREARPRREAGEVPAFFGDVDVATFVDAQEIGNRVARRDRSERRAIARAEDVDVRVWHEERAGSKDGLEAAGRVRFQGLPEDVPVNELARARRIGDELAERRV